MSGGDILEVGSQKNEWRGHIRGGDREELVEDTHQGRGHGRTSGGDIAEEG